MASLRLWTIISVLAVLVVSCAPAAPATPTPPPKAEATPSPVAKPAAPTPTSAPTPVAAKPTPAERVRVRYALSPAVVAFLPTLLAIEKGYFAEQGLDVELTKYTGPAPTQIPVLARGDVDLLAMVPAPGLFNAIVEGVGIKLLASLSEEKEGWLSPVRLVVRKDLWDSGAIREPKDLKGKRIDAVIEGVPIAVTVLAALEKAGLKKSDVVLTYKNRTPADWPVVLKEKAVDVQGMVEPSASLLEKQGLGAKWLSLADVAPWHPSAFVVASEGFFRRNPDAIRRFLVAQLKAHREVIKAKSWTPELIGVASRLTGFDEATLRGMGPLPYVPPDGTLSLDNLSRVQDLWFAEGLVKQKADLKAAIDTTLLDAALKEIGKFQ